MSTVEQQVKAIVAEQLGVKQEQVTSDASFVDDLGADRKSTRLNSSHSQISYAVFCLKKKKKRRYKRARAGKGNRGVSRATAAKSRWLQKLMNTNDPPVPSSRTIVKIIRSASEAESL